MKKNFLLLLGVLIICFCTTSNLFAWSGSYSIACPRCQEVTKQASPLDFLYCHGCPMWRCYGQEPKGYMVYRCPHGHEVYIDITCDKSTRDLQYVYFKLNGKLEPVTKPIK